MAGSGVPFGAAVLGCIFLKRAFLAEDQFGVPEGKYLYGRLQEQKSPQQIGDCALFRRGFGHSIPDGGGQTRRETQKTQGGESECTTTFRGNWDLETCNDTITSRVE